MANLNELLDGHVTLEVECIDRLYLNGYVRVLGLGGHLKTGHGWTLQKRPTELSWDKSSYTLSRAVGANFFRDPGRRVYTSDTWAEDTATQGCDRSADPGAGMAGRRRPPLIHPFWRESEKSQGFGDSVPK